MLAPEFIKSKLDLRKKKEDKKKKEEVNKVESNGEVVIFDED